MAGAGCPAEAEVRRPAADPDPPAPGLGPALHGAPAGAVAAASARAELVSGRAILLASHQQTLARLDASGGLATAALRALARCYTADIRVPSARRAALLRARSASLHRLRRHRRQPRRRTRRRAQALRSKRARTTPSCSSTSAWPAMDATLDLDLHRPGRVYRLPLHFIQGDKTC